ncbi:MAG TPA: response regulator transcription factor [Chloroflexota bacterium]|jgi:two-component system KDP operon response regulator KdpE|nr:response regulator transcription factor [Chloroflexota bacterium]
MAGSHVLVIDDDREIRRVLRASLTSRGYVVETADGGREGVERLRREPPDVVLLDLSMPDLDGVEVVRQVRRWSRVPIIVLSVSDDEHQKVRALDTGADDYLTKPFGIEELLARIRVALRRAGANDATAPIFRLGELVIDYDRRRVTVAGEPVSLTPTEYGLLKVMTQHVGKVVTHRTLLREVWGPDYEAAAHYLHVYIARLRRKLEPNGTSARYLVTEPGAGYRLWCDELSTEKSELDDVSRRWDNKDYAGGRSRHGWHPRGAAVALSRRALSVAGS